MAKSTTIGVRIMLSALLFAAGTGCTAAESAVGDQRVSATTDAGSAGAPVPDPVAVQANELGVVPILMYHQLSAAPVSDYDQTPAKFRAELDRLYRENYRPVTASAFVSGAIDIPAGTHPVVLTFDDSTLSQVSFTDNGQPAPDTALGILEQFRAEHPDFAPTATFYVNNEPFAGDERALPWLAAHGYEIGAHTAAHANLGQLDGAGVQRELAENVRAITAATPAPVRTMALPLGIYPADRALAVAGDWAGTRYAFDSVMLVGAEPAPSPFGSIDRTAVPRIRSGREPVAFDSTYWLDRLAEHPDQRYTSDGNPIKIIFPAGLSGELNAHWSDRAQTY
ncbi:polysaccharide deacetylase family protein [Nocardia brasiliensis]|uniref:polysaccharide deacetylase family protein n=1 Tax=Nocardia brasiliensis TaxID=37326 RepID=UPI0033CE2B82